MKHPLFIRKIFCIAALVCAAVWSANAQNIVQNAGFETGTYANWTTSGNFINIGPDPNFAHSGNFHANLGSTNPPANGTLSQSLTTIAGQSYNLTFWLANDQTIGLPPTNSFSVFWNNGVSAVFSITNQNNFAYTQFTISGLVATGTSTNLAFNFFHNSDFWRLDDISVTSTVITVPEAFSTLWLGVPALAAFALLRFSRGRFQPVRPSSSK